MVTSGALYCLGAARDNNSTFPIIVQRRARRYGDLIGLKFAPLLSCRMIELRLLCRDLHGGQGDTQWLVTQIVRIKITLMSFREEVRVVVW